MSVSWPIGVSFLVLQAGAWWCISEPSENVLSVEPLSYEHHGVDFDLFV